MTKEQIPIPKVALFVSRISPITAIIFVGGTEVFLGPVFITAQAMIEFDLLFIAWFTVHAFALGIAFASVRTSETSSKIWSNRNYLLVVGLLSLGFVALMFAVEVGVAFLPATIEGAFEYMQFR